MGGRVQDDRTPAWEPLGPLGPGRVERLFPQEVEMQFSENSAGTSALAARVLGFLGVGQEWVGGGAVLGGLLAHTGNGALGMMPREPMSPSMRVDGMGPRGGGCVRTHCVVPL